jgi:uncharacterized UPF0160 family protein
MKKIVTHDGDFHADDVFAVATLTLYLDKIGEKYRIIRTRDEEIIEKGDYVLDVGGIYDEDENKFDHHQENFKDKGLFDIPYSSFGLIWKHFGMHLIENKNVWKKVKSELVTQIDANDNGIEISIQSFNDLPALDMDTIIFSWLPPYNERTEEKLYTSFLQAIDFARDFLVRTIHKEIAKEDMREEFEIVSKSKKNILKTDSLKALILPKPLPWADFLEDDNDIDFVVFQRDDGNWMARAVPTNKRSKKVKFSKRSWMGLENDKLIEKTGVNDLILYHKTGYVLLGKTKESIIKTLEIM